MLQPTVKPSLEVQYVQFLYMSKLAIPESMRGMRNLNKRGYDKLCFKKYDTRMLYFSLSFFKKNVYNCTIFIYKVSLKMLDFFTGVPKNTVLSINSTDYLVWFIHVLRGVDWELLRPKITNKQTQEGVFYSKDFLLKH